jgi:hypothetical protein
VQVFGGGLDGTDPLREERIERVGPRERRPGNRSWLLGTGTLACPECDAPVRPITKPMGPADALACPLCDHAAAVRDFLSLAEPARPARVEVRVVMPARVAAAVPGR